MVGELVDRADVVFHLAAAVGVKLIVSKPVRTIETNVRGTEVVLQAAAKKDKLVVVASTSEVYGKGTKIPFSEDDDLLLGPTSRSRWGYACSKAMDEYLVSRVRTARSALPVILTRLVQHSRAAPDRTLRHGAPDVRPARALRGDADHGLRRRASSGAASATSSRSIESLVRLVDCDRGAAARSSTSAATARSRIVRTSPNGCATMTGGALRRSSRSPTTRRTRKASRISDDASPTSRSSNAHDRLPSGHARSRTIIQPT